MTFSILDESTAGELRGAGTFACDSPATTLREILRQRVRREVERFNDSDSQVFQGLIQPEDTERLLNGVRPARRTLDWERQYARAVDAFQGNGFLVLVGDRQITVLDEIIELRPGTQVTFLKLVPLMGG